MKTINTVFAVHNHQPIGNFDKVFEEAYQHSYRPFLDVMERHPTVKFTQHWTGTLLEWLAKRKPDLLERMKEMVKRGQLELLTGAYYEAILAVIPEHDRIGQIKKLTEYIHALFDVTPRGMWLAERVWEQPLVASLAKAGVGFVMVDDTHFRHAGLHDHQLLGYYVTEEEGYTIKVMPIDKMLRYTVPFRPLDETMHYFQRVASGDGLRVVINADDGEKFGVWPKTFKHVYEDGWLESFCRALEHNNTWLQTVHAGQVADSLPPQGRVYLPTASYAEMMKWALDPTAFLHLESFEARLKEMHEFDDNAMFVRGGYWRNFLAKYPEANHMHKKMLRVASRARRLSEQGKVPAEVWDHIWAGQCNDPLWHGVFGGLYLPNLRFPVYRSLLRAESMLDAIEKPTAPLRVEESDFDCDGANEVLVESDEMNMYFKPSQGGSLVELDYKPIAFNMLDIMSRREEGYHRRLMARGARLDDAAAVHDGVLAKELGLEKHLHFDWYRHAALLDHCFGPETTLEGFARCRYLEVGDFVNQPYRCSVRKRNDTVDVVLERDGALWSGSLPHRLTVRKNIRYTVGSGRLTVDYTVHNREDRSVDLWFGVEFSIGLMAGDAHDRYYSIDGRQLASKNLQSAGVEEEVQRCSLVDEWLGIETTFTFERPATVWRFPIETVSLSEAGFEKLYQCSVVTPNWKVKLEHEFSVRILQTINKR